MLDELNVSNLGIISKATIEPSAGLVVVTGETGAGKTLLLGALRLLTGEPARRDQVGPHDDEADVAGRFISDELEVVITRRVAAEGRSRAYIDGAMVTAKALQASTEGLVEIVAQHDHLLVGTSLGILALVDGALDAKGKKALAEYAEAWDALEQLKAEAEVLGGDRRALERELDMARFQAEEIAAAGFAPGEDDQLAQQAGRLRNHEAIAEGLAAAVAVLGSDSSTIAAVELAVTDLRRVARYDESLTALADQGDEILGLFGELSKDVVSTRSDLDHKPGQLDGVEGRLALLGDLRRKYGDTLQEVLSFGEEAAERADEIHALLGRADELEHRTEAAHTTLSASGAVLTKQRIATSERIAASAVVHLQELGFGSPVIDFVFEGIDPAASGTERMRLLFASDSALSPGPVSRVASGGELSRLILALRLSAGATDAPVIAFDEIDAGIGGATALAMGRKLSGLATGRQVLCVTHLPQVAAFADQHFVVRRNESTATVEQVRGGARLEELARMLAGMPDSERGIAHAEELLAQAAT